VPVGLAPASPPVRQGTPRGQEEGKKQEARLLALF
jgi:hypothetical protein